PAVYETAALPTELRRPSRGRRILRKRPDTVNAPRVRAPRNDGGGPLRAGPRGGREPKKKQSARAVDRRREDRSAREERIHAPHGVEPRVVPGRKRVEERDRGRRDRVRDVEDRDAALVIRQEVEVPDD